MGGMLATELARTCSSWRAAAAAARGGPLRARLLVEADENVGMYVDASEEVLTTSLTCP